MNIYDIKEIESEIETIAEANNGEIPEEKILALVQANNNALVTIEKLIKYIKHLEYFSENADKEIQRIRDLKKTSEYRIENIKNYLIPFVKEKKTLDVGTFHLKTRKSLILDVFDEALIPNHCLKKKIEYSVDKQSIKEFIKNGGDVPGATIIEKENLLIGG